VTGAGAAAANSNAQTGADATTGLDRAQERMSVQGKAHEKATVKNRAAVKKSPKSDASQ